MPTAGLSELNAFIAIAEQRSFRGAARLMELSPSALSHAMRGLEARLGVRLFNRTTRSVALTEAGEKLLARVRPAMADLAEAVNEVASARDQPSGSIRISASEAGARPLIQQVLPAFLAQYPDIQVEIVVDGRLVDIVADGFDAGVRLFEAVPLDMVAIRFGPDFRLIPVAAPAYLDGRKPPKAPSDLAQHRCIRFRFDSGAIYRWEFARHGRSAGVNVAGPITLANTNLMVDAALAGIGIAFVAEEQVRDHLAAGRLVALLADWCPSYSGMCLYYPANRHPPTALRLFAKAVRAWAASNEAPTKTGRRSAP